MTLRFRILVWGAFACSVFAVSATAENGDWYAGASNGFRGLSANSQAFEGALSKFGPSLYSGRLDEPVIEKHYTGFRFNDLFAIEGLQSQLAAPVHICGNDTLSGDLAGTCHGAAWSVSGVAMLPLNEGLSFYGRLGLQYLQQNNNGESRLSWPNAQDMGATYGIGVSYEFRKDWYVHAESERFSEAGRGTGLRFEPGLGLDNTVHSIGLSIRF